MDQQIPTATLDTDDLGDRPTLPSHRPEQRGRCFDEATEHFFSNVETLPELKVDAAFRAKLAAADDDTAAWWSQQRRAMHLPLVAAVLAASLTLLLASLVH